MKYNPIMCMNVPDSVKTKDTVSNVKVGNKYKINGKEYKVIRANISQNIVSLLSDNFERLDMKFDEFMKKANDSANKSIDKAIKNCDTPNIKESLKQDIKSGKITIKQAGKEMYEAGMFNWIPDENEVKRKLGL